MSDMNENLAGILGVEPLPAPKQEILVNNTSVPATQNKDAKSDFEQARDVIRNMMLRGEEVLDELIIVAKETESPRAYEVASTLIKTVTDAAKDMVDLHKKMKDINEDGSKPAAPGSRVSVQQAVFVGSTNELQKMIRARKEENAIDE